MRIKAILYSSLTVLFSGALSFFLGDQSICCSSFPLDNESVFCIYYKISGEDMAEQDLEELCFSSGRPTFSAFKPSEMFMKNALRRLKHKLNKSMKEYDENTIFKWSLKWPNTPNKSKNNSGKLFYLENEMPRPTPFISSEMTRRGQRSVSKLLNSFISKSLNKPGERVLNIVLYLKPKRIDYRYKNRNIAHEDVRLPFRCVIFYQVKMEIFPFKHPDQMLMSRTIHKPFDS